MNQKSQKSEDAIELAKIGMQYKLHTPIDNWNGGTKIQIGTMF